VTASVRERTGVSDYLRCWSTGAAELGVGCPLVSGVVRDLRLGVWPRCGPAVLWEITFWCFSCCWFLRGGQWA
jgi:hypothetical protein